MNLFDLFAKISLDTSEYESGMKNASQDGQGLKKSMTDVQKQSETLGNKIKVLSVQYESSAKDVEGLTKQFNDSVQKTGAASRESQELADKLAEAEKKAKGLKGEIDGLNTELSGLSGETKQTSKSFSSDLTKAADLGVKAFKALAAAVVAKGTALVLLAESTREYRTEMGKLNTAFETNGFTAETAYETYADLQSILGDTGQTVEAINNLSALADSEEDLSQWTTILTGAYAKFGASLPVEGLAEAANETSRTGILTGGLTDAINWAAEAGENFGVTLKKNIEFTEASKEELAKMTEAQLAEYEARKAQYEEIEEYNQKVSEATNAEEFFQIALDNCTTSQERQKLITETLSDLYTEAGEAYLDANEDLINANKSQERLNKAMADLGESVEPAISEFKDLGASILEDLNEPVQDATKWIRQSLIPGLRDLVGFVRGNGPAIVSVIATVGTALAAVTVAVKGAAAAQAAYNAVMSLSPFGAVAIAITALTAGVVAYGTATRDVFEPTQHLTDAELELLDAANQAAEAFDTQREATEKTMSGIDAQMGHVSDLATELQGLADASGNVQEKDRARAEFILGQLNEALGTEYEMVDGVIQQYDTLTASIEEVIQKKTANALLEAANADYITALQNEATAYEAVELAQKNYDAQLDLTQEKYQTYLDKNKEYQDAIVSGLYDADSLASFKQRAQDAWDIYEKEMGTLGEVQAKLYETKDAYRDYRDTILNYEDAQVAALEGSYQEAQDILLGKKNAYEDYSANIDLETAKVLKTLADEAIQAGIEAQKFNKNWEKGTDGVFQTLVTDADDVYAEALSKFANAYADAMGVGSDFGEGLSDGLDSRRQTFLQKAAGMISSAISAMRQAADSHSPSRKTMALSEDMGDGSVIGIEKSTPKVVAAAKKQTNAVLAAYSGEAAFSVATLSATQLSSVSARSSAAPALSGGNVEALLTQILHKLDLGVYLDGKTLVGKLAGQMDTELGLIQASKMRGVRV